MDKLLCEIPVTFTDGKINTLLKQDTASGDSPDYSRHFTQNEEFFLSLSSDFRVPQFPIHHDIEKSRPDAQYLDSLHYFLEQVVPLAPPLFKGLTYFFNPTDTMRPGFYQIYKIKDRLFLYLLQLDISFRTHYGKIVEKGGNDKTHTYTTQQLFIDNDLIPLETYKESDGRIRSFVIEQLLTQTWVGEQGKGYFIQGIWIDRELTKFFSKLFLPKGKRTYPYYPFPCKHRTLCHSVLNFDSEGRKRHLSYLYRARDFLLPYFEDIQDTLKDKEFSEELPLFKKIKKEVPERWNTVWESLTVKAYLNDQDMKEFAVDYPST
ncbi:MAG: hypothetical protein ACLFSA_04400 [Spirochaetaceae bacterium]